MGPLSISVLLFTALVLSGGFAAPRAQEQREKSVVSERAAENTSATARCDSGWSLFKSHCFHFISQSASWVDAQVHCITLGGSLVSVHSLEEYRFVQKLTRGADNTLPKTWIGGIDAVEEGKWLWIDGTPFDFTNWAPDRPDNKGPEHCLEMNFGGRKQWNDLPCSKTKPFVCAKQAS
uniref:Ladderlectin-like n=1 Tax=Scleropages formosus TaxID=113540 RepID=A0A8C9RED5_SCLFO